MQVGSGRYTLTLRDIAISIPHQYTHALQEVGGRGVGLAAVVRQPPVVPLLPDLAQSFFDLRHVLLG